MRNSISFQHLQSFLAQAVILVGLVLSTGACDNRASETEKETVIVSIPPLSYFVKQLAPPELGVSTMVRQGFSPATYEPLPSQISALTSSRLFLGVGHLGYELAWREQFSDLNPDMTWIALSEGMSLIRGNAHSHGDHDHEGGVDPHIWTGPAETGLMVSRIKSSLEESYPEYRIDTAAFTRLLFRIDSLLQDHTRRMAPFKGRRIYLFHPSLGYYCRHFGLRQEAMEREGKEPSPAHLAELGEQMRADGVRGILVQREFDMKHAEVIAKSIGIKVIPINPLGEDWFMMMDGLAKAIEEALGPVSEGREEQ